MSDYSIPTYMRADTVTRGDVRVNRRLGWVTTKRGDNIIGTVAAAENGIGQPIWRAYAGDISAWANTREGAVEQVIELHNMQQKARSYDLLERRANRPAAADTRGGLFAELTR